MGRTSGPSPSRQPRCCDPAVARPPLVAHVPEGRGKPLATGKPIGTLAGRNLWRAGVARLAGTVRLGSAWRPASSALPRRGGETGGSYIVALIDSLVLPSCCPPFLGSLLSAPWRQLAPRLKGFQRWWSASQSRPRPSVVVCQGEQCANVQYVSKQISGPCFAEHLSGTRTDPGQAGPKLGRLRRTLGQICPELDRNWPFSGDVGQLWPASPRSGTMLGKCVPISAKPSIFRRARLFELSTVCRFFGGLWFGKLPRA